jgi:hypothetical protein
VAGPEVVEANTEDGEIRTGNVDGRWTNIEKPNGCYNESLLKLAEQRCGGLVEHPLWPAGGLDEFGRIRARISVALEDLPARLGLVFAFDEKDDGPRRVYDGDG